MKKNPTPPKAVSSAAAPKYPTLQEWSSFDPERRTLIRSAAAAGVLLGAGAWVTEVLGEEAPKGSTTQGDFSALDGYDPQKRKDEARANEQPTRRAAQKHRRGRVSSPRPKAEFIVERRSLYVRPGYRIALEWTRSKGDDAPVAARDGAVVALVAYLGQAVTDPTSLHDAATVQRLESGVLELLGPLVAPAEITVLHLTHSCGPVCGKERPMVRGRIRRIDH